MGKKTRIGAIATALLAGLALLGVVTPAPAYAKSKERTGAAIRSWPSAAKPKGAAKVATRPAAPVESQSAQR